MDGEDSTTSRRDPREIPTGEPETSENALFRWVMVDGSRWAIVVGLSLTTALVLVGLGVIGVIGVRRASLVTGLFTASITGVFTLVSITITINQLVLSRILGSPGLIMDRIDAVRAFRTDVSGMVDGVTVSPTDPAAFMELVTHALSARVDRLLAVYGEGHAPDQRRDVEVLCATLRRFADDVDARIGSSDRHLFHVLTAVLNNRFSKYLNQVRRVKAESEGLTPEEGAALDDLESVLVEINRTRHYFKTLYLHEELASLSRVMLLSGIPAIVVSFATVLLYDGVAQSLDEFALLAIVSAALAVVLLPLTILLSFSLRFITIAKRTTTFGTFTPPEELP